MNESNLFVAEMLKQSWWAVAKAGPDRTLEFFLVGRGKTGASICVGGTGDPGDRDRPNRAGPAGGAGESGPANFSVHADVGKIARNKRIAAGFRTAARRFGATRSRFFRAEIRCSCRSTMIGSSASTVRVRVTKISRTRTQGIREMGAGVSNRAASHGGWSFRRPNVTGFETSLWVYFAPLPRVGQIAGPAMDKSAYEYLPASVGSVFRVAKKLRGETPVRPGLDDVDFHPLTLGVGHDLSGQRKRENPKSAARPRPRRRCPNAGVQAKRTAFGLRVFGGP